jgi:hypothetical protein
MRVEPTHPLATTTTSIFADPIHKPLTGDPIHSRDSIHTDNL